MSNHTNIKIRSNIKLTIAIRKSILEKINDHLPSLELVQEYAKIQSTKSDSESQIQASEYGNESVQALLKLAEDEEELQLIERISPLIGTIKTIKRQIRYDLKKEFIGGEGRDKAEAMIAVLNEIISLLRPTLFGGNRIKRLVKKQIKLLKKRKWKAYLREYGVELQLLKRLRDALKQSGLEEYAFKIGMTGVRGMQRCLKIATLLCVTLQLGILGYISGADPNILTVLKYYLQDMTSTSEKENDLQKSST